MQYRSCCRNSGCTALTTDLGLCFDLWLYRSCWRTDPVAAQPPRAPMLEIVKPPRARPHSNSPSTNHTPSDNSSILPLPLLALETKKGFR